MKKAMAMLCFASFPAQSVAQTAAPSFDAASIKPSRSNDEGSSWHSRPGYLVMKNQTLNACIQIAYGLKADQVTGGPKWLDSDRFDIESRATTPAKDPELLTMLQTLLAERFQLKIHRDSKLVSGYDLVVVKKGLKIRPVDGNGPRRMNWGKGQVLAESVSMASFAGALARMLGAPVQDKTGLSGEFGFKFDWSPESQHSHADAGPADLPSGRSLFTAVQEELGLALNPTKAQIEIVVVDKAESRQRTDMERPVKPF
jgi:uncharacterized protein (TIGR03435 family)